MKVSLATLCAITAFAAESVAQDRFIQQTRPPRVPPAPAVAPPPAVDGVLPRMIRSGNPLQMLNPAAPPEYGYGQDMVSRNPTDPYQKPKGIRLFAIEF